jgi:hypothetical protein
VVEMIPHEQHSQHKFMSVQSLHLSFVQGLLREANDCQVGQGGRLKVVHCEQRHLAALQCQGCQIRQWPQMLEASICHPGICQVERY